MMKSASLVPVRKMRLRTRLLKERNYHIMILPGIVFFLIFCYYPMFGLIMAFQEFKVGVGGFWGSPWVGTLQFKMLFRDKFFWAAFQNTVGISSFKIIFGFICPIIFALMINEIASIKYKRFVQTTSYLPYFISWVVVASIMTTWLGTDFQGIINIFLVGVGILKEPIPFLAYNENFWAVAVISDIWKNLGWSSIIYLSAISGVDQELYEAATVDGAGRLRKMWNVTLPSIKPTMSVILILSVGNLFKGSFEQSLLLQNQMNMGASDILETFVLRYGIRLGRFSMATAAGLFQSALNLAAVFLVNIGVRLLDREQGLF